MEVISFLPTMLWAILVLTYVFNDDFIIKITPKRDRHGRFEPGHEKTIYCISSAKHIIKLKRFIFLSAGIVLLNLLIYLGILWL